MALTQAERNSLQVFKGINLNRNQVEIIINRALTDREWKVYNHDYKPIFKNIAKQAANVAEKKFKIKKVKPSDDEIERLRSEKYRRNIKPYLDDSRRVFREVALEAAKSALTKKTKDSTQKKDAISQLAQIRKQKYESEKKIKTYEI